MSVSIITIITTLLATLGESYLALRYFKLAQQFEAAEYLNKNRFFGLLLKLMFVSRGVFLVAPLPIALMAIALYIPHCWYLFQCDTNCNQQKYNKDLKFFWTWYLRALVLAIVSYSLIPTLLFEGVLQIAAWEFLIPVAFAFPFAMHDIKKMIAPTSALTQFIHMLARDFELWGVFLALLDPPQALLSRIETYMWVMSIVARPLFDWVSRHLVNLVIMPLMRLLNVILSSRYVPRSLRTMHQMYYDELSAYHDYCARQPLTYHDMKDFIAEDDILILAPAVENLYLYDQEPCSVTYVTTIVAEEKVRNVFETIKNHPKKFHMLLTCCAQQMPYWDALIKKLQRSYGNDAQLSEILRESVLQPKSLENSDPYIGEFVTTFHGAADHIIELTQNPAAQLASSDNNKDFIHSGLAALCDKYFAQEAHSAHSEEAFKYQHDIIARMIHKTMLCQDGLIALISEELSPTSTLSPLKSSWVSYMSEEIKKVHNRCDTIFVTQNQNNPVLHFVGTEFAIDSENVDHQKMMMQHYLPEVGPHANFTSFPKFIFDRHMISQIEVAFWLNQRINKDFGLCDAMLSYGPLSVRNHLVYPGLFSAESVEEMIERTQQLYAHSIADSLSPTAHWATKCQALWDSYLNEVYPYHRGEQRREQEEHESGVLLTAYRQLSRSVKARYNLDISYQTRAGISAHVDACFGKNTRRFLIEQITQAQEPLPQGFDTWSERKQRDYLHLNKPAVHQYELDSTCEEGMSENPYIVSREFALVVLFSEGIITTRHPLHEKIGKMSYLSSVLYPEKALRDGGYTKAVL